MNLHQHLRFIGVIFVLLSLLGTSRMQSQNQRVTMLEDGQQATVFKGTLPGFYLSSAEVKSSGIEFHLFLSGVAESSIEEYGIIWNDNARPDYYKNTGRYAFPEPVSDGAHTYEIKNLPLNKSFFAYAYIIVGRKMIVSNEIYFFTSQASSKMMRTSTSVSTGCGGVGETIFLDKDNENNAGTGVADDDFGVYGSAEGYSIGKNEPNHPIEFNLFTTKEALMDGILAINAYDVDEDDFNSSPEKIPEIDEVYFEGELLGHLSGNNNIFNTTTFRVPKEKIKKGKNRIEIRVSQPYNGVSTSYWFVKVTSAQLLINGGVGDKASIGELTINKAEKTSSTVNVEIAADIKVCTPSNFSVETNLIGPDKSNVYTNKTSFSASSDVTDKALQLELPLGSQTGTYTANFYLFDTGTGIMLHSASINIEHTKNVGVDPVVVAITPSTEISTNQPVVLTCKAKSVSSGATIVGVKAPGASVHNGKNEALYTTEKNGTYTFTVYYRENGTDKSKDISYTVKNITLSPQTITWNQDLSVLEIDTPITLNATASSHLAITYEVSDPSMATIENGILTFLKIGEVTITALQGGGSGFSSAVPVAKKITVRKATHTLNWNQTFETAKVDMPMELTAISSKNIAVIYNSSDNAIASIIGNKLTFHQVNKQVTITATSGNDNFDTVTASKDITITQKGDTPTDAGYPEIGTGDNAPKPGETVVFPSKTADGKDINYTATPTDGATIVKVGDVYQITINKVGEVIITATVKGDTNHEDGIKDFVINVEGKGTHTLNWNQTFETAKVDVPMELIAVSSKNIAVVYNSSDEAIASIIGNRLTFHQVNKQVNITAISGDDNYKTETVSKEITITQKGDTPTDAGYPEIGTGDNAPKPGEALVFPSKTTDGKDITYTATPVDGATILKVDEEYHITIVKVGKVIITASIAGDANHEDASKDFVVDVISKGNHTLTWNQSFETAKVDVEIALTAISSKNVAVVYNSTDEAIANIVGNKLTFHQVNKQVTITATSGNDNYDTETVSKNITITQKGDTPTDAGYPEIGTGDNAPKPGETLVFPSKTTDGKDINYTATPVDGATILKVDEEYHITIVKVGKVIITASIAGDANHEDASKDFVVDVISKGNHTLTWNQSFETAKVGLEITLTAVSSKNLTVVYNSSDNAIASIVGNKLTFHQVNKQVTITATSGNDNYDTETVSKNITITQKGDTPTDAGYPEIGTGDNAPKPGETINFPGKTEDGRDIIYTATPTDGATIVKVGDEYRISINKIGEITITATVAGDANHEDGTKDFVVNVESKGLRSIDWTQEIPETTVGEKIMLTASVTPSGGIVKYTSSDTSLAYIKDNTVIAIKEGTVSLHAVVDEDTDFNGVTMGKSIKINPLIIDENTDGDVLPDESEILDKITVTIKEDGTLNLDKELGEAGEDVYIKEMVIQQKDQYVGTIYTNAANNVYPEKLTLKAEYTPNKWHFISFPFDLKISDINKVYGADYFIAVYDTEQRAENKRGNWKMLEADANTVLKTNQGYLIQTMAAEMVLEIATTDAGQIKKAFTTEDVNLSLACPDANGTASQYNKGWNFVGTPYLSFYKSSFDNKILYVYDEKTETYIPVGKDLDLESYNLRPWSGFMLQSGNASEILPFLSSDRANSQLPQSIRAYNGNAGNRFAFELRRGDSSDRMIVTLNKEASNDYVINEDAAKFFSMNTELPQIYTMTQDGGAVAMNCIPECNEGNFSLFAKTPIAGDYELVMIEIPDGFNDVILHGGGKNIVLKQGEPYIFAANAGEVSFDVVYSRGSVNIEKEIIDGTYMSINGSTLQIGELPLGTEIRLFSSTGALMHSTYTKDTAFSYELPSDGVYIVRITINGLEKVFKVIR